MWRAHGHKMCQLVLVVIIDPCNSVYSEFKWQQNSFKEVTSNI